MKATRIQPGVYELRHGRGSNQRTFRIEQIGRGNEDGLPPGWAVHETGIQFLTITDGWSEIASGLPNTEGRGRRGRG